MRVSVAVVPGLLVSVSAAGRDEPLEQLRQVPLQSRLELDRTNRGRAADIEDLNRSRLNAARLNDRAYVVRQVVHRACPARFNGDSLLVNHKVLERHCVGDKYRVERYGKISSTGTGGRLSSRRT